MDVNLPRKRSIRQINRKSKLDSSIEEKPKEKNNPSGVISKHPVNKRVDVKMKNNPVETVTGSSQNVGSQDMIKRKKVMVTLFKMNLDSLGPVKNENISKSFNKVNANHPSTTTENAMFSSNSKPAEDEAETIDKIRNEIKSFANVTGKKRLNSPNSIGESDIKNKNSKVPRFHSPKRKDAEPQSDKLKTNVIVNDDNEQFHDIKEIPINISPLKFNKSISVKIIRKATSSKPPQQLVLENTEQNQSLQLLEPKSLNSQNSSSMVNVSYNNSSSSPSKIETLNTKVQRKSISKTPIKTQTTTSTVSSAGTSSSSALKTPNSVKSSKKLVRFGDEITPSNVEQNSGDVLSRPTSVKEGKKRNASRGKGVDKVQQTLPSVEVSSTYPSTPTSKQTPRKMRKVAGKAAPKSKAIIDSSDDSSSDQETLANLVKRVHNKEDEKEENLTGTPLGPDKVKKYIKERKKSQSPRKKSLDVKSEENKQTPKKSSKKQSQQSGINDSNVTNEENIMKGKFKQQRKVKSNQETRKRESKEQTTTIDNNQMTKSNITNDNQDFDYESDISITDGSMPVVKDSATTPKSLDPSLASLLDEEHRRIKKEQDRQKQEPPSPLPPQKKTRGRKKLEDGQKRRRKRGRKRLKEEVVEETVNLEKPFGTEDEEEEEDDEEVVGDLQNRKTRKRSQRRTGRRFSVTGNWYIASGFLNDIISLLEDFESIEGWRFKDFAKCWQKKNFSLVYRGRQTFKELLEFSEEIALLTKRFLNPPHSMKRRIGALYALYGLYYKFPLGKLRFFHLRFEYGEYEDLLSLIFPFRSNVDNPDPAFIFRKLELEGAILHCASAIEPCYDFHNEERDHVELEYGKERLAKSSAVLNAVPKTQLQADLNLLQHYHSLKAKVAGQDVPEKALSMITPEFLLGISTNLNSLRQNTLEELGMSGESASILKSANVIEEASSNQPLETPDFESELELYSVDQRVIDTVNKGSSGQRSQNALQNNKIVSDQEVKEFMRPPTTEDLCQPLLLCGKSGKIEEKEFDKASNQDVGKSLKRKQHSDLLWDFDGKLNLDIEEPREEYSELTEALLPQPLPPKKRRRRKRPAALKMEASLPPRSKKRAKNPPPVIVKSFSPSENKENLLFESSNDLDELSKLNLQQNASATRLLVSELPNLKPKISGTIIKVRMKADGIRKLVKLKIKIGSEQFAAIQKNPLRFNNFKNKLKPLIKATQKDEHKNKDWCIEDIFLDEEEANDKQSSSIATSTNNNSNNNNNNNNKDSSDSNKKNKKDSSDSPKKFVPFKAKYECLKYSDDEEENIDGNDEEYDDDDEFRCKWKTEEEKDNEYCPPEEEEPEDEPLEFQDEGIDDEYDDDYVPEPNYFWRKKRESRSYYYGNYFEERGPRDSDQLLKPRSKNSISMVPMHVGGKIKYFPMIQTQENTTPKNSEKATEQVEKETEGEGEAEAEELPKDPNDAKAIYTWNDFSSDKSPPFKKRRTCNSFSYIFSPKINIKDEPNAKPILRKIRSSTIIKEMPKQTSNQNVNIKEENDVEKEESDDDDDDELLGIKKEKTVLEELAGDWDEEESTLNKLSHNSEKLNQDYSLNTQTESGVLEEFENNVEEVYVEDTQIYPIDDADIVDAPGDFQDSDQGEFEENQDDVFVDNVQVSGSELSNSLIEEATRNVSQILPDLAITSDFENDLYLNSETNRSENTMPICTQNILPGNIIMTDCSAGDTLRQQLQAQSFVDVNNDYSSGFNIIPDSTPDKQSLYYKTTAADGNSIFIPISFPNVPAKDIKILSFDVADVKPLIDPTNLPTDSYNVASESFVSNSYSDPQEQISPDKKFISNSSFSVNNSTPTNPLYLNTNSRVEPEFKEQNSINQPSVNTEIDSIYQRSEQSTTRSCSFFSGKKPIPVTKPRPSVDKIELNDSSTPRCSFLFSRKLEKTFKNFPSAKGKALGKVESDRPKVKFLMKGMFKFAKKS